MFLSVFKIRSSILKGAKMLKKILLSALGAAVLCASASAAKLTGVGATFPMPIYKEYSKLYFSQTKNQVSYSGGGSGKGIASISAKNSDFGGSDEPQKPEVLKEKNLIQFPAVIGAVVLGYNLANTPDLNLDANVLAGIYSGEITKWNDEKIAKLNPGVSLPNNDIIVVVRSDASGTTFNFTNYLANDEKWKYKYGVSKNINWDAKVTPVASNPLVATMIEKTPFSIGYLEYSYAGNLGLAKLKNSNGEFVAPNATSFGAASKNANFSSQNDFYKILTNARGAGSYPLVGASFILLHKDGKNNAEVAKFFNWALSNESAIKATRELGYEPIDANTAEQIKKYLEQKISK